MWSSDRNRSIASSPFGVVGHAHSPSRALSAPGQAVPAPARASRSAPVSEPCLENFATALFFTQPSTMDSGRACYNCGTRTSAPPTLAPVVPRPVRKNGKKWAPGEGRERMPDELALRSRLSLLSMSIRLPRIWSRSTGTDCSAFLPSSLPRSFRARSPLQPATSPRRARRREPPPATTCVAELARAVADGPSAPKRDTSPATARRSARPRPATRSVPLLRSRTGIDEM